jgi:hypothetical protein
MAMRRASQAVSGRHAAIGRGFPFAVESSVGGDVRLDRRPCRKAMRPPMIARLLIGLKIESRWLRSAAQYGGQITSCSRFSGGQKGDDHEAVRGPSRLGAYTVRLCVFARRRSCRWHDRT